MPAGLFRDQCDVISDGSAAGNPVPDYTTYAAIYERVPCDVSPVSGVETFRGRQLEATFSHVVEMHYLPNVTPRMRVNVTGGTFEGRELNVQAVKPLDFNGRTRKLQLFCTEIVDT